MTKLICKICNLNSAPPNGSTGVEACVNCAIEIRIGSNGQISDYERRAIIDYNGDIYPDYVGSPWSKGIAVARANWIANKPLHKIPCEACGSLTKNWNWGSFNSQPGNSFIACHSCAIKIHNNTHYSLFPDGDGFPRDSYSKQINKLLKELKMSTNKNCYGCGTSDVGCDSCRCCYELCDNCNAELTKITGTTIAPGSIVSYANKENVKNIRATNLANKSSSSKDEGQEFWINNDFFPNSKEAGCTKVMLPSNCPTCAEPIKISRAGDDIVGGCLTSNCCSHVEDHKDLIKMRIDAIPEQKNIEYQDWFLRASDLFPNILKNKTIKVSIPKCCPDCDKQIKAFNSSGSISYYQDFCSHVPQTHRYIAQSYLARTAQTIYSPEGKRLKIHSLCPVCCEPVSVINEGSPSVSGSISHSCGHLDQWDELVKYSIPTKETMQYKEVFCPKERAPGKEKMVAGSEKIMAPTHCPDCGNSLDLITTNNTTTFAKCIHIKNWEDIYSNRKVIETQKVFIQSNLVDPMVSASAYSAKEAVLPKCCPDCNKPIEFTSDGSTSKPSTYLAGCEHIKSVKDVVKLASFPNDTRESVAGRILKTLEKVAWPFGGYLRDKQAKKSFKDIDLFFPRHDPYYPDNVNGKVLKDDIKKLLEQAGFSVQSTGSTKMLAGRDAPGFHLYKSTYSVTEPISGIKIDLDLVSTDSSSSNYDHPFIAGEADINKLFKRVQDTSAKAWGLDKYSVDCNIADRTFKADDHVPYGRILNLIKEGFSPKEISPASNTETLVVGNILYRVAKGESRQLGEAITQEIAKAKNNFNQSRSTVSVGNKSFEIPTESISLFKDALEKERLTAKNNGIKEATEEKIIIYVNDESFSVPKYLASALADAIDQEKKELEIDLEKERTMDKDNLKVGEKYLISIKDSEGAIYEREATCVYTDAMGDGNPLFALREYFESDDGEITTTNAKDFYSDKYCDALVKDGHDPLEEIFLEDDYYVTVLNKISTKKKDNKKMSSNENGSWISRRGDEAIEAGKRTAANQMVNGVQAILLKVIKKSAGLEDAEDSTVRKILASKAGHAMIGAALGELVELGNGRVPGLERELVQEIGREFRVGSMAEGMNEIMDTVSSMVGPLLGEVMGTLDEAEKKAEAIKSGNILDFAKFAQKDEPVEVNLDEIVEETVNQQQQAAAR